MKVADKDFRTIWAVGDGAVEIIDQTRLPHEFVVRRLETLDDAARAIATMQVRGAPLIGATAAYGLCLALRREAGDAALQTACEVLAATRPTGRNLFWALARMRRALEPLPRKARLEAAYGEAAQICDQDVDINRRIGDAGLALIADIAKAKRGAPVQVLTHCNAGWLATVDWGTATAPIYRAHRAGIAVHVWVDETRPRNQGAALTAFELGQEGVPHTVIVDNAGGHLMQQGAVDLCLVGTDRTTARGDVANKIGTYLKALAAFDNDVPFYVAAPSPSIDWELSDGVADIAIEERAGDEVACVSGRTEAGRIETVRILPEGSGVANYAFDITPARLVSGLITERGLVAASRDDLARAFPDLAGGGNERRAHG